MKKSLFLVPLLLLAACQSGVGRAASLAVSGVPPTVPAGLDSIEAEYDRLTAYEMHDITSGTAVTPEGIIAKTGIQTDRQARIDATKSIFSSIRQYIGVDKGADPTLTQTQAAATKTSIINSLIQAINQAKLEQAAQKTSNTPPANTAPAGTSK